MSWWKAACRWQPLRGNTDVGDRERRCHRDRDGPPPHTWDTEGVATATSQLQVGGTIRFMSHMTSYHPIRVRGQTADPLPILRPGAALKNNIGLKVMLTSAGLRVKGHVNVIVWALTSYLWTSMQ